MTSSKFLDAVARYSMLQPGEDVLVGFSGGADSVCLLHLLYEYKDTFGISLRAAHVNHGLRGEEADRDERFAVRFCRERDIPLKILHADIPALAKETNQSTELCAREVRYRYFRSLQPDKIATAHTGSDAAETLLMNLSRGASLHGLASIPPVRGNIIRPLISCLREDTEAYCEERGLEYMTDSTNLTDEYTRNKFRHTVIPALKTVAPSFEQAVCRCLENLRAEDDYMRQQTAQTYGGVVRNGALQADKYLVLHPALRLRVLAEFLERSGAGAYETKHLRLLDQNMANAGFALTLPEGVTFRTDGVGLSVSSDEQVVSGCAPLRLEKDALTRVAFNGFDLSFEIKKSVDPAVFHDNYIDFSKIDDIIIIRSRCAGDQIRLARRNCTKTLKKLYCELALPHRTRALAPVITDSRGVIWAYGAGVDRTRLADENTTKILIIHSGSDKNDS